MEVVGCLNTEHSNVKNQTSTGAKGQIQRASNGRRIMMKDSSNMQL